MNPLVGFNRINVHTGAVYDCLDVVLRCPRVVVGADVWDCCVRVLPPSRFLVLRMNSVEFLDYINSAVSAPFVLYVIFESSASHFDYPTFRSCAVLFGFNST